MRKHDSSPGITEVAQAMQASEAEGTNASVSGVYVMLLDYEARPRCRIESHYSRHVLPGGPTYSATKLYSSQTMKVQSY
jgi:hypothetical protein